MFRPAKNHSLAFLLSAWVIGCFIAAHPLRAQSGWTLVAQDVTQENLWSAAYGAGTIIAVGERGTIISRDDGDRAWHRERAATDIWLVGAGYGAGRFIVVGDGGTILASDDHGVTWTARDSGTKTRLNAVAYGGGRWLVVGENGTVLTSRDGNTWAARPALGTGFLRALAYGQGRFLIGGASGVLYTTTDADSFTRVILATTANIEAAAISATRFWIVGSNGLWASATQLEAWSFGPNVTATTFRGLAARSTDEAVAVAESGAAMYRNGAWSVDSPAPPFLGTAVVQTLDETIAVGFGGGIARAEVNPPGAWFPSGGAVEYGTDVTIGTGMITNLPTSYQWYTAAGALISGATQATLAVKHITPETSAYRVEFTQPPPGGNGTTGATVPLYPAGLLEVRDPGFVSALPFPPMIVAPQPDGKLLVSGFFAVTSGSPPYGLARLNADGSLDPMFHAAEAIAASSRIREMHVLPDGRIYVLRIASVPMTEDSWPGVARLLANGALDARFQPDAALVDSMKSALAPDGRLYVQRGTNAVFSEGTIVRLTLAGAIDPAFGPLKKHDLIGVDSKGRLLAIDYNGTSPLLVRYLGDGMRDPGYTAMVVTAFGQTTYSANDLSSGVITDSGLYAASAYTTRIGTTYSFFKVLPDGGRDPNYQSPPSGSTEQNFRFAYRPDGRLWQITRQGAAPIYVATSYSPTGAREVSYATLPTQADYSISAIAPDGSLLAITNRYVMPSKLAFVRIRPVTGRVGRLTNLSVRASLPAADEPLIAGFVTSGIDSTSALVRAIGPGLTPLGVSDSLRDPQLTLMRDGAVAANNNDWDAALAPRFASVGAFSLATGSKDAALESAVSAGNYTAVVTPAPGDSGTGLVELYQAGDALGATRRFVNVSARGRVDSTHPLIAGFTITGDVPVTVLVRAAGPALAAFGVPNALGDPQLTLYRGSSALWDNDDWSTPAITNQMQIANAMTAVGAFQFSANSKDSAMLLTLAPGNYTAVVTGANGTSGTALVEVYEAR